MLLELSGSQDFKDRPASLVVLVARVSLATKAQLVELVSVEVRATLVLMATLAQ